MPLDAIVSDDAVTSGWPVYDATKGAQAHDWLCITGGGIGQGLPVAIGAAIAAPQRKVIALTGDGSGAYVPQSLWTMARESLDVVVILCANRAYRILDIEFARTKSGEPGPQARKLLALDRPNIDWTAVARGFGVTAMRCESAESFDAELARAVAGPGPALIEAVIP
jgi:acetolactate synthase-1/2/3 large subunit